MKRPYRILLCCIVLFCLVEAGAALTTEKMDVDRPVDALKPKDVVTVTGILKLPPSGSQTFDLNDIIELYTQLEKPTWATSIIVNGNENPYNLYGTTPVRKIIDGNDLAYPTDDFEVKVSFSVSGAVPSTFTSGSIVIFRALELDEDSEQVGAAVYRNGTVFNIEDLRSEVTKKRADLTALRTAIDQKIERGIDVSAAEKNYTEAKKALEAAEKDITSSPGNVAKSLSTAATRMENAQTDLKRAWASQTLGEARAMLSSVDGLITEFTVNRSLKTTDPRLSPIITKRDLSARSISDASDLFTTAAYDTARTKATDGLGLAEEAWNLSLTLKEELDKGLSLPLPDLGALLPFLVIGAVILVIAGVIIYRKKTRWDELG